MNGVVDADFADLGTYRAFVDEIVGRRNANKLEGGALESAIEKYLEYVGSDRLDRSEPIEDDEQPQAELASDLSEAFADLHPIRRRGGKELQPIGVLRRPIG